MSIAPSRSPLRTAAFILALVSLSSLVGLALLEIGLRVTIGGDRYFPYYPDSVRVVYPSEAITPGVTGPSRFSTNSFGTRGREPSGEERLRILTIGGSTTADTLLDDSEAWPARLEVELGERIGDPSAVWVANSGIDGLNSEHHLMHATYLLPQLPEMDLVILYAGANDMGLWFHHTDFDADALEDPEHWNGRIGEAFRWSRHVPPDWPAYKRSEIWKTLSRLKDRYLSAQAEEDDGTRVIVQDAELQWLEEERARRQELGRQLLPQGKLETLPTALETYEAILARIITEIRRHGAEPVFVPQVVQSVFETDEERARLWMGELAGGSGYVSEEQYPVILREYNARMAAVAREHGAAVIDLPSLMEPGGAAFYDGMHFNEPGAAEAAMRIAAELHGRGIVDEILTRDPAS